MKAASTRKQLAVVAIIIAILVTVVLTVVQADKTPPTLSNVQQVAAMSVVAVPGALPNSGVAAQAIPEHLDVLFVGDSTSAGGPLESYRKELGRLFDLAGVDFTFVVEAHGGWTCAMWTNWMQFLTSSYHPDLTVIDCGINDAANGWGAPTYDNNYSNLINQAKAGWPATKVIGTWLQYSANRAPWAPWLQQEEATHNDAVYRQTINRAGVIFPPVNFQNIPEIYLLGPIDASDPGGLHSTPAGNDIKGRAYYNALRATYSLPNIAPVTCGLMANRPGYGPGSYVPCNTLPA